MMCVIVRLVLVLSDAAGLAFTRVLCHVLAEGALAPISQYTRCGDVTKFDFMVVSVVAMSAL